jgi:hypothetical protein
MPCDELSVVEQVWDALTGHVLDAAARAAVNYFTEESHARNIRRCVREAVQLCGDVDEGCHRCHGNASGPCERRALRCPVHSERSLAQCLAKSAQVPMAHHFHWPRTDPRPGEEVSVSSRGQLEACDQLNMMCEEPLPLCAVCGHVCPHCAESAMAASSTSSWERVASPPGPTTSAQATPKVSTRRRPTVVGRSVTTTTAASSTSTTWRPNPRPVARAAAAEGQQQMGRPARFQNLQGQATQSQLDYLALLSRRAGIDFDGDAAAESLTKQEASELIDSLLRSRLRE